MYDDVPTFFTNSDGHVVPEYPLASITTPIALFHGKKDTLPDLPYMKQTLPNPILEVHITGTFIWLNLEYEHLHFLWGEGIDQLVYPAVLGLLNEYNPHSFNDEIRTVPWISQSQIVFQMKKTNIAQ